ncbi:hypothetical protein I4U23_000395 [Adineta vaga]|nr:hypothetical protein I4U23_000395 [Adineta vaga]
MSQNLDYCQLAAAVASPPTPHKNPNRIPIRQYSVPTSPEFNLSSNESFPSLSIRSPPIATDGSVSRQNVSSSLKIRENKTTTDNPKYSFTLNFAAVKKDSEQSLKPRFYKFDMTSKNEQKIHSQFYDNKTSNLHTPSSDQHDTDALSDAGTYNIDDDDVDPIQDTKLNPSSSIAKRYVNQSKTRHGTFDLRGIIPQTSHTVNRPVVDVNIPTRDLSLSSNTSSASSLHSFVDDDSIHSPSEIVFQNKSSSDQFSYTTSSKNQIKPAESFVISPTFEAKTLPNTSKSERKVEVPWRAKSMFTNDASLQSKSSTEATQPIQNTTEKESSPPKASTRPHTSIPSSIQLNSPVSYSVSTNSRQNAANESISKIPTNKSFFLRQQHSNTAASTSKSFQPQTVSKITPRQPLKQSTSIASAPSSTLNSNSQTNRAVELRRARAQAKIEELAQRTKKQSHKQENTIKTDIMSTSWHSSTVNTRSNLQTTKRPTTVSERENLSSTRTISLAAYHRSASPSPNSHEQKLTLSEYRQPVRVKSIDMQQSQRMTASAFSLGTKHCDTLREDGQRLAIRLIQLSSGILQKLKLNDAIIDNDTSIFELQKLVENLQTINQTLTTIDAALTGPINDDAFV